MGAHVLVVDDDPHMLRMLTDVLGRRGFSVEVAKDGEEGYERASARAPDLLVTDVMMPRLDGWSLVRKLRLEPRLATLPVIFLTALADDGDRVKAFRLGADDYINKPFKLSDLVARVEKVLGPKEPARAPAATPAPAKPAPSSGLNGDLAQVALSTLLVLIEMERKTGVLNLTAADGRTGKMAVRDGKVLDARIDNTTHPTPANAVYVMLTWSEGKFAFTARSVEMEDKIGQSTTHLLMEGARLMDEASAPDAEAQLNEEAIAEWQEEERAPIVTAAKLADFVRHSARASLPPYTGFSSPGIKLPAEDAYTGFSSPSLKLPDEELAASEPLKLANVVATPAFTKPEPTKTADAVAKAAPATAATVAKSGTTNTDDNTGPASTDDNTGPANTDDADATRQPAKSDDDDAKPAPAAATSRERSVTSAKPARRASPIWLVLGFLVAGGGATTFAIHPAATKAVASAVDVRGDAAAIGNTLDRGADTARMRAGGFASMPMLRTGIETDAATVRDMAASEAMLQPGPGEVLEIFQTRDGATTSLLRTPATAAAIALDSHARIAPSGKAIEVIATSAIKSQQGADAGVLAVAVAIDLHDAASALSSRVTSAKLVGLEHPLELVPAGAAGTVQTVPVPSKAVTNLSLEVVTPAVAAAPATATPVWLVPARYGAFALAGLLLLMYLALLARRPAV